MMSNPPSIAEVYSTHKGVALINNDNFLVMSLHQDIRVKYNQRVIKAESMR